MRIKYRLYDLLSWVLDNWPDLIGLIILLIGIAGEIPGRVPYPHFIPWWLIKLHQDLSNDLIAIGITVLIIDNANQLVSKRAEKRRLILQLGSPDNAFTVEAVRQIEAKGWLTDGSLRLVFLLGANLSGADLSGANLYGALLNEANLRETDLSGANLSGASMVEANMSGAHLTTTNLSEANLGGADLSEAYLGRAYLSEASLGDADLSGASLIEADLSGADLHGANLSGADLSGANLNGVDLRRANLRGARITNEQLALVTSLEDAIMPDGKKYDPTIHILPKPQKQNDPGTGKLR